MSSSLRALARHSWLALALALAVSVSGRPDAAGASLLQRFACRGAWLTAAEIAASRGVPASVLPALRQQRNLGPEDLCRIPDDRLARAMTKVAEPKPDNPLGWWNFRRLQLQDENGKIAADGLVRATRHLAEMRTVRAPHAKIAGINPGQWTWLGPGNVGGRIRSILTDPADANRLWIGSVSGGIWTTVDGGNSWNPVNDFLANLAVNTMAMDPTNADVMYAGTGEGFFPIDNIRGIGIFKSTNRGANWTQLASTATSDFWYVNRVAVSPNGATLLAATWTGLFRSTNGGTSWANVSPATGYDVDFDPMDSSRAVAGGNGSILYSTNGGASWSAASLPSASAGRIEVAYARSAPAVVYAAANLNQGEVWKSSNGGQSFSLVNTGSNLIGGSGWYSIALWVDPTNPNVLIVGGLDLWRSTNGGTSFSQISVWYQAPLSAHADHHVVVSSTGFNGAANRAVYFGNDGGIYRASDVYSASGSTGWQELNNGLGITQFYGAGGIPSTGKIVGGTQDNGTLLYTLTGGTEGWTDVFGGDGGFSAADPVNTNYLYGEYVNLDLFRGSNGTSANDGYINGKYWNGSADVWKSPPLLITDAQNGFANFIAPFILDPNTPNRLLAGGRSLWRTDDPRTAATPTTGPAWAAIKPPNATNANISAIAVAPGNSDVVWAGHNDGDVFRTTNGTAASPTWTQVDTGAPGLPNRYVSRISIDPTNANVAYVVFGGFSPDNVWRTANAGGTWADVTGAGVTGLPDVPVRSLVIHPDNPAWLYAGTEVGVFTSENSGANWSLPQDGPANVSVDELFWMDRTLIAATHGRGIYKAPTSVAAQVRVVGFTTLSRNVSEAAGALSVAVRISTSNSAPTTSPVTVDYATASGTATSGADFTPTSGTLTFPVGTASGTALNVTIPLTNDGMDENEETFTVSLSGAAGASLGQTLHTVYLADDDPPPVVSINDVSVIEGNVGVVSAGFGMTVAPASGRIVTVGYATADSTATVAPGTANGSNPAAITIPDSGAATPYPSSAIVSGAAGTVTKVRVTLSGLSHTYPSDIDVLLVGPTGQKVVLMSDVGGGIPVSSVTLTFDDTGPGLPGSAITSGTYRPTDLAGVDVYPAPAPAGPYSTALAAFNGTSPNGTWSLFVRDEISGDFGSLATGWSLSIDTAAGDYQPVSGTVTFAPGVTTQPLGVLVNGDTTPEANETFFLNLSAATNATIADGQGVGTITNDDTGGPVLSINDVSVAEGNGGTTLATFTVSLSPTSGQAVTVNYTTANGTATAGSDYVTTFGPLTIPAGSASQSISVTVNGDGTFEPNETFFVNLSAPVNAVVADAQGMATITNDDAVPSLSIGDVVVPRDAAGTIAAIFPINLSAPSSQTVSANYATADGTATAGPDYVATSGGLSIAPGNTTASVSVTVNPGPAGETFFVNLTSPTNATLADGQGRATLTAAGQAFHTVTPCRVVDTRNGPLGAPSLVANLSRSFTVAGSCGVPPTAKAVSINVTVTGSTAPGNLRLYPSGTALPLVSAINYVLGQTRANNAVVGLGSGALAVRCDQAAGTVHLILDVNGYFE